MLEEQTVAALSYLRCEDFSYSSDSRSRHLGRACPKHFGYPFRAVEIGGEESLQFFLDVVLDPANRRSTVVEKQVRSPGISVIREANTSGVDQEFGQPSHSMNGRAMCMPKGNDGLAQRAINGFQFLIGCFS